MHRTYRVEFHNRPPRATRHYYKENVIVLVLVQGTSELLMKMHAFLIDCVVVFLGQL